MRVRVRAIDGGPARPLGRAVAAAAKRANVVQIVSTFAARSLEEVASAGGAVWFQLYVFKKRAITETLVKRAERAGCKALVLTVDVPAFGLRDAVVRSGFKSPPHIRMRNFDGFNDTDIGGSSSELMTALNNNIDPRLCWNDIRWLRAVARARALSPSLAARQPTAAPLPGCSRSRRCPSCSRASCRPPTPNARSSTASPASLCRTMARVR